MAYAETTTVPMEKSLAEIVGLIKKAGAQRVGQVEDATSFAIQFFLKDRMIRFRVTLPGKETIKQTDRHGYALSVDAIAKKVQQLHRQRARALLLVIKAKLESIESGVETFEEAFLANVVMADGRTVYERIKQPIALEYDGGEPMPMLLTDGGRHG